MMTKLTLKEFISELDACLKKFGHDGLKEIIRGHAMKNRTVVRRPYIC